MQGRRTDGGCPGRSGANPHSPLLSIKPFREAEEIQSQADPATALAGRRPGNSTSRQPLDATMPSETCLQSWLPRTFLRRHARVEQRQPGTIKRTSPPVRRASTPVSQLALAGPAGRPDNLWVADVGTGSQQAGATVTPAATMRTSGDARKRSTVSPHAQFDAWAHRWTRVGHQNNQPERGKRRARPRI